MPAGSMNPGASSQAHPFTQGTSMPRECATLLAKRQVSVGRNGARQTAARELSPSRHNLSFRRVDRAGCGEGTLDDLRTTGRLRKRLSAPEGDKTMATRRRFLGVAAATVVTARFGQNAF